MREIATFYDAEEARIAAGYLRGMGYDVTLAGEHHLGVAPHLSVALGGYRLYTPYEQAFMAKSTLEEKRRENKGLTCPACGDGPVRRLRHGWFAWLHLLVFGLPTGTKGMPFSPARKTLVCRACGHQWKENQDEP